MSNYSFKISLFKICLYKIADTEFWKPILILIIKIKKNKNIKDLFADILSLKNKHFWLASDIVEKKDILS